MPPDLENGTAQEQPADDIRSALAAAMTEHEAADTPDTSTGEKPVVETGERQRGPDGKFLKAEGDDVKPSKEKSEVEPELDLDAKARIGDEKKEGIDKPEAEKPEGAASTLDPPANWSKADKEKFQLAPVEIRGWLLDRHKAMEADYTKKTQGIAALKNEYEPVEKLFEPYRDAMRAKGFTPRTLIEGWANVEKRLMSGDGVAIVKGLVDGYQIDPAKVAAALGLTRSAPRQEQGIEADLQDPAIQAALTAGQQQQLPPELLNELRALKERQDAFDRDRAASALHAQQSEAQAIMSQIDEFKGATDGKGNLLHPHFDEVEGQMTDLANAARARGQRPPPLKDLYETAVWANPSTRDKLRTAEQQSAERKRQDEARAKAAAARQAGSSVTGAPGTGQASTSKSSELSLREQLEEAANEAA